jgi:hypothetical protein
LARFRPPWIAWLDDSAIRDKSRCVDRHVAHVG